MKEEPEIELKSKVERVKDLIRIIGRAGLAKERMKEAVNDVGSLIVRERFEEEELLELRDWMGKGR